MCEESPRNDAVCGAGGRARRRGAQGCAAAAACCAGPAENVSRPPCYAVRLRHALPPPATPALQAPGVHARGHQGQAGGLPMLRPQKGEARRCCPCGCIRAQQPGPPATSPCASGWRRHAHAKAPGHTERVADALPRALDPRALPAPHTPTRTPNPAHPAQDLIIPPMASPNKYVRSPLLGAPSRNRTILAFFKGARSAAPAPAPQHDACQRAAAALWHRRAHHRMQLCKGDPAGSGPAPPQPHRLCASPTCRPHAAGQPALQPRHPPEAGESLP